MALAGRRVLLTGAAGFVGRRVHRALLARGAVVGAVTGPNEADGIDLSNATATRRRIADFAPQAVLHLAAASSVGEGARDPDRVWRNNFDATRTLAQAAAEQQARIHLVFASSAEVYGRGFLSGPCDEDAGLAPTSTYGRTKAACELLLADIAGDHLPTTVLRLFNHTGPGQDARFVAPALARQIAALGVDADGRGRPGTIQVGNLDAARDFTDVDDVVDAYLRVLDAGPSEAGLAIYNVGSGRGRTIRSVLDRLIAVHGAPVQAQADPQRMRPSEIPVAEGRFERFQTRYGWRPERDFDDTLAALLKHERATLGTPGPT